MDTDPVDGLAESSPAMQAGLERERLESTAASHPASERAYWFLGKGQADDR